MVRNVTQRTIKQWSVVVLGLLLLVAVGGQVYRDDDLFLVDLLEVGLPIVIGVGLILAGFWMASAYSDDRITSIAAWTVSGAIFGILVNVWFVFIVSLEHTPAGEPIVLNLNGAAIFMAVGTVLGQYATGIQQREKNLEVSESRFRALTENSPFTVITIDETSTIRYTNDAIDDLFGYSSADLVGEPLTKLMPERFRSAHCGGLNQYLSTGTRTLDWDSIELAGLHADGDEFPIEISFGEYAVNDDHLFTGIIHDITDRKRAEEQLQAHTTRVTRLHEIATEITTTDTKDDIYQLAVDRATDLFPCDVARIAVAEDTQLIPAASSCAEPLDKGDPRPMPLSYAGMAYQSGEIVRIGDLTDTRSAPTADAGSISASFNQSELDPGNSEMQSTDGDQDTYRALLSIPLTNYGVLQLFAADPDMFNKRDEELAELFAAHVKAALDRIEAEATIRRERDRLDEFAGVLSHDIRNPLNVAQGRLEILQDADEGISKAKQIEAIDRSLTRIQRLIEDVLALARQGETVGAKEPVSLDSAARQAWDTVATKNADIHIKSDLEINADRSRLCQLFENLYRNAIEHGGTDVTIRVGQFEDGFYIEDTGPGIPANERERVFEHGHSTHPDGTGYGLTIAKRIVEAHNWQIIATDGTDGGARFEITGTSLGNQESSR